MAGCRTGSVYVYPRKDQLKSFRMIQRLVMPVRALAVRESIIAIAGDDATIILYDFDEQRLLHDINCHKKAISLSFDPINGRLDSLDSVGEVKIWKKNDCVKTISIGNKASQLKWSAGGDYVCVMVQDGVFVINAKTWKAGDLMLFPGISHICWYKTLVVGFGKGEIRVWHASGTLCTTIKLQTVADIKSFTVGFGGLVAIIDSSEELRLLGRPFADVEEEIITSTEEIAASDVKKKKKRALIDDEASASDKDDIEEEDENQMSDIEDEMNEMEEEEHKDMPQGRSEAKRRKAIDEDEEFEMFKEDEKSSSFVRHTIIYSGRTQWSHNSRFLTWNTIGCITAYRDSEQSKSQTVEIEFHDKSQRTIRFDDDVGYDMASFGVEGAVFGCNDVVHYIPFDGWTSRQGWTICLKDEEMVEGVATWRQQVFVVTSKGWIRAMSTTGLQSFIRLVPGKFVSMVAGCDKVLLVTEQGDCLKSHLMDIKFGKIRESGVLGSNLEIAWSGVSENGRVFAIYDRNRTVLVLDEVGEWMPVMEWPASKSYLWPIGLTGIEVVGVEGKKPEPAVVPRPIISNIPLSVPIVISKADNVVENVYQK